MGRVTNVKNISYCSFLGGICIKASISMLWPSGLFVNFESLTLENNNLANVTKADELKAMSV